MQKGCISIVIAAKKINHAILFILLLLHGYAFCQDSKPEGGTVTQGYVAIFHPIAGHNAPTNFRDVYIVGFPIGINVFKTDNIGYSFELFPFIQADSMGSKVNKIVFHPGLVFKLKKGFGFTPRVAFESTGRYGLTQVLSKAIVKTKTGALGGSLVFAERFGNSLPPSFSYGIGIGISF